MVLSSGGAPEGAFVVPTCALVRATGGPLDRGEISTRNSLLQTKLALEALEALETLCSRGHDFEVWVVSVRTQRP
jgi:hypothetical protein